MLLAGPVMSPEEAEEAARLEAADQKSYMRIPVRDTIKKIFVFIQRVPYHRYTFTGSVSAGILI